MMVIFVILIEITQVGNASDEVREVYDLLWLATEAGINAAKPGLLLGMFGLQ